MRLRIWVEDDLLSPDTDSCIYTDITLKFDLDSSQMQEMLIELAAQAHAHYTNRGEKRSDKAEEPISGADINTWSR